jgi:hypothetical protein
VTPAPLPAEEIERLPAEDLERICELVGKPAWDADDGEFMRSRLFAICAAINNQSAQICRLEAEIEAGRAEDEKSYQVGKDDGRSEAVQEIDRLTGGDGEYVYSTYPGEGCPGPADMIKRIVERFEAGRAGAANHAYLMDLADAHRKELETKIEIGAERVRAAWAHPTVERRERPSWPWPEPDRDRIHGGWQIETSFLRKVRESGLLANTSLEEIEDVLRSGPVRKAIDVAVDTALRQAAQPADGAIYADASRKNVPDSVIDEAFAEAAQPAELERLRNEVASLRASLGQQADRPAEPIGCPAPGACSCRSAQPAGRVEPITVGGGCADSADRWGAESACLQPHHWDDGVPYCTTCGLYKQTVHRATPPASGAADDGENGR